MTLLFRVLRTAHAKGSHHKLALDALPLLTGPGAEGWARVFLKHAESFMTGSKAPDDVFKDFKNHVLHPRDGYWGGAPEKVDAWYQTLIGELRAGHLERAVYAAGVMSHYLVDPMHPFHTGQSEAENNIHRALEWSINRSFDALAEIGRGRVRNCDIAIAPGTAGLKDLVCRGADKANASYELLIAHYNINKGVSDPPAGLDTVARNIIGELIVYATTAIARVIERALAEAAVEPPEVELTLETIIATLKIPVKQLAKRLADAQDRKIVQAMYDELSATGRVDKMLPEDDRAVRTAFAAEVMPARLAEQARARAARVTLATPVEVAPAPVVPQLAAAPAETAAAASAEAQVAEKDGEPLAKLQSRTALPRPPLSASLISLLEPLAPRGAAPTAVAAAAVSPPPLPQVANSVEPAPELAAAVARSAAVAEVKKAIAERAAAPATSPRIYLKPEDDIEAAPSIGPKTAEALAVAGLRTVADLLAADPDVVAAKTGNRHIDALTVRDWQDQARLVCTVPGLRGTGAQLLVGAGYRSLRALAEADAGKLSADVLAFAATSAGHRILREGQPPDIEKIKAWAESAKEAVAKAA